ncbi:LytTR family transcriptional regulator DNA-binding domain-containing protein [Pedobacter sp. SYP-B3415]|uniref:LytTR family transcriptional regulator DNA-binding domain-containing protein n=1 Tax=Pedobacter sp. SYP-B3415 TaxID=2496641 RepID=UPI00101C2EAF|nr:LytTR family transcriptional regulator DNA-binding domain-containing protein [Pedobacter sp. SYP-B3415]
MSSLKTSAPKPRREYLPGYAKVFMAIAAAHFIIAGQQTKPLWRLITQRNYYVALVFSFVIALLLIELVEQITKFLDKKLPWQQYPWMRFAAQFIFAFVGVLYLDVALVKGFFYLFDADFEKSNFMIYEFVLIKWMLATLNFIYWVMYRSPGLFKFPISKTLGEADHDTRDAADDYSLRSIKNLLNGKIGTRNVSVDSTTLAGLICKSGGGFMVGKDGKQYRMSYKTEELSDLLPGDEFVQTNRGVFINLAIIEGHRRNHKEGFLIFKSEFNLMLPRSVSRDRYRKFKLAFDSFLTQEDKPDRASPE